jgi:predicted membrane-bound mannosyltransferase/DNA-binding beta-propeller fold protein YncE
MEDIQQNKPWLERPLLPALPAITNEIILFSIIILTAIVSRFYNLGLRVMSHDESLHTYFSWLLYKGDGYQHNPMMHGPLQFHFIALSYSLLAPNDFTARIPAALFSIATIWMTWYWRRYLGKTGALLAGVMMVISPIMLFYGRYVREDAYAVFSGVLMLYTVLRYFESGERKYLFWLALALVIHFADKETSYIYAAELLLFLAIYFIARVTRNTWSDQSAYRAFMIALVIAIMLIAVGAGWGIATRQTATVGSTEVAAPINPSAAASPLQPVTSSASPAAILVLAGLVATIAAGIFLVRGYTWARIKSERAFDMLMLTGTLVLPMLVAFPVKFLQPILKVQIPTTAPELQALTSHDVLIIGIFLLIAFGLSIAIGQLWDKNWWKLALTFWVPFTILYTTVFTNTDGFFTGVVGSLGYWLVQQGVQRGSQPWYYYILIQIPVYEFLPLLGASLAILIALRRRFRAHPDGALLERSEPASTEEVNFPNTFALLFWWSLVSIIAFSMAGEKMPWLTYHLTWPMILLAGWGLGTIIDSTDWRGLRQQRALLVLAAIFVFLTSLAASMLSLLGPTPPFQGKDLQQLQNTSAFLLPALVGIASAVSLVYLLRNWSNKQILNVFIMTVFSGLAILTARTAFRAAYINYDNATEYLVYAHASTGVKDVINQATEISKRTTGGMGINIAYDASAPDTGVSWPFVWYLRDFTNQHSFDQPTRALRDSTIVIVDSKNFDKIDQALGPGYYRIDYIRMWWPNQDYFNLVSDRQSLPFDPNYSCSGVLGFLQLFKTKDFSRICSALLDPKIRAGIVDIWLNRDYTAYAAATGHTDLTLATWQPSDQMRMYIRKDVAQQIWKYGALPTQQTASVDPYQGKTVTLTADQIIDSSKLTLPMNAPRSLAFAADGTFFVADSRNHRILHFDPSGTLIDQWGTPSGNDPNKPNPSAPPSTFNEPWGVAVGPDGSVYVSDTWNHRIQKFTTAGQFVKMWGVFGQGAQQDTFYGPRGIAVDAQGKVYVVDTGNKRIVVFDSAGNYLTQFGSAGLQPGQFDEPVGIAIDSNGIVYITDTWNQRIQSFSPSPDGLTFTPLRQWDVVGWNGQSLDNKPFIAVDNKGHLFVTDPDGYRVIEYTTDGQLIQTWGDFGSTSMTFALASGIAIDPQAHVWVTDAGNNNRIMRFTAP